MENSMLAAAQRYTIEWDIMFCYYNDPLEFQKYFTLSEDFFEDKRIAYMYKKTQEAIDGGFVDNEAKRLEELYKHPSFKISTILEEWIVNEGQNYKSIVDYIDHCKLLDHQNLKKKLGLAIENNATSQELQDVIEVHNAKQSQNQKVETSKDIFDEYLVNYDLKKEKGVDDLIVTDYDRLDSITNFKRKQLFILGARPSIGKSALALNMAYNAAMFGQKVLFLSVEMDKQSLIDRLLAFTTGLPAGLISKANANKDILANILSSLSVKNTLILKETPTLKSTEILELIKPNEFDLVVIDYLQILKDEDKSNNENIRISRISANLQRLAKEMNCAVLALSQLNRDNEKNKRKPILSDLRDSGAIEANADLVGLLHREDRMAKVAWLEIAKNRHGSCESVPFTFDPITTKFTEISEKIQSSWDGEP